MSTGAAAQKAAARARTATWRNGLRTDAMAAWSREIRDHLLAWPPLASAHDVLGYSALRREPQTAELLAGLAARGQGVWLPVVIADILEVAAVEGGARMGPERLDAVLVPGMAFDRAGHRLGRGGGHYDRFLGRLRPDCLRIGVCFGGQVLDSIPLDPWDEAMDVIVTERGIVEGAGRGGPGPDG